MKIYEIVRSVLLCAIGVTIFSSLSWGAGPVENFLSNSAVSLLGWIVSFIAGCIAIVEFFARRATQRKLKKKEIEHNDLEGKFKDLQIEYNQLKVSYDQVSVSGRATYARENHGVMNIDNRDG